VQNRLLDTRQGVIRRLFASTARAICSSHSPVGRAGSRGATANLTDTRCLLEQDPERLELIPCEANRLPIAQVSSPVLKTN